MKHTTAIMKGGLLLLLVFGLVGCDSFDDLFENEKEVQGIVEAIAADGSSLTVDGIVYRVTSNTEYEGISGLADLSVGDEVEIEYEEQGGDRVAVEVELAGADDDD